MSSLWEQSTATKFGFHEVAASQVCEATEIRRIDVREYEEFTGELGHIPGVELVPLGTLAAVAKFWDRNETVVVICRSGERSTTACGWLQKNGFSRVINMSGGMLEYVARGLPISREGQRSI